MADDAWNADVRRVHSRASVHSNRLRRALGRMLGATQFWPACTLRLHFGMSLAFSRNGQYLAVLRQPQYGTGHVVKLWDAGERQPDLPQD